MSEFTSGGVAAGLAVTLLLGGCGGQENVGPERLDPVASCSARTRLAEYIIGQFNKLSREGEERIQETVGGATRTAIDGGEFFPFKTYPDKVTRSRYAYFITITESSTKSSRPTTELFGGGNTDLRVKPDGIQGTIGAVGIVAVASEQNANKEAPTRQVQAKITVGNDAVEGFEPTPGVSLKYDNVCGANVTVEVDRPAETKGNPSPVSGTIYVSGELEAYAMLSRIEERGDTRDMSRMKKVLSGSG